MYNWQKYQVPWLPVSASTPAKAYPAPPKVHPGNILENTRSLENATHRTMKKRTKHWNRGNKCHVPCILEGESYHKPYEPAAFSFVVFSSQPSLSSPREGRFKLVLSRGLIQRPLGNLRIPRILRVLIPIWNRSFAKTFSVIADLVTFSSYGWKLCVEFVYRAREMKQKLVNSS